MRLYLFSFFLALSVLCATSVRDSELSSDSEAIDDARRVTAEKPTAAEKFWKNLKRSPAGKHLKAWGVSYKAWMKSLERWWMWRTRSRDQYELYLDRIEAAKVWLQVKTRVGRLLEADVILDSLSGSGFAIARAQVSRLWKRITKLEESRRDSVFEWVMRPIEVGEAVQAQIYLNKIERRLSVFLLMKNNLVEEVEITQAGDTFARMRKELRSLAGQAGFEAEMKLKKFLSVRERERTKANPERREVVSSFLAFCEEVMVSCYEPAPLPRVSWGQWLAREGWKRARRLEFYRRKVTGWVWAPFRMIGKRLPELKWRRGKRGDGGEEEGGRGGKEKVKDGEGGKEKEKDKDKDKEREGNEGREGREGRGEKEGREGKEDRKKRKEREKREENREDERRDREAPLPPADPPQPPHRSPDEGRRPPPSSPPPPPPPPPAKEEKPPTGRDLGDKLREDERRAREKERARERRRIKEIEWLQEEQHKSGRRRANLDRASELSDTSGLSSMSPSDVSGLSQLGGSALSDVSGVSGVSELSGVSGMGGSSMMSSQVEGLSSIMEDTSLSGI